jgi:DNA-binding transcriptional LysR family regulator
MELNQRTLRYLVTVADEGHFGRAAALLHVSGPALSKQIRKLEAELGLTLLDRGSHPVRLTAEGAEFVAAAREVLAAADHAVAVAEASRRRLTGALTIGFVLGFAGQLTRPILDGLAAAEPQLPVELVELGFGEQVAAVWRGTVDASFVRAPLRPDRGVRFEPVLTEPRCVLLSARHPLAGRGSVRIAELAGEPQVRLANDVVDPEWSRWWSVDPRPDGSRPDYLASIHTINEFLEFVAGGRAMGITTPSLGEQFSRSDIALVPIADVPASELFLCTRDPDRSPSVAALRRVVRDVAGA